MRALIHAIHPEKFTRFRFPSGYLRSVKEIPHENYQKNSRKYHKRGNCKQFARARSSRGRKKVIADLKAKIEAEKDPKKKAKLKAKLKAIEKEDYINNLAKDLGIKTKTKTKK